MESNFWINAWSEGKTGFHQEKFHEKMVKYFPQFKPVKGQKVLVPLCGKTRDMLWLHEQGLQVRGVELAEMAIEAFFKENKLPAPRINTDLNFKNYVYKELVISCGDFFKLEDKGSFDFVYDRAALVALPESMRNAYAEVIHQMLRKGGKYLLITYEYDQAEMSGPPFSVVESEVRKLYEANFSIKVMETQKPDHEGVRMASVNSLTQKVYILEKK